MYVHTIKVNRRSFLVDPARALGNLQWAMEINYAASKMFDPDKPLTFHVERCLGDVYFVIVATA